MHTQPAVYHPRDPKDSPLWNLLAGHYDSFLEHYEEKFKPQYGYFRPVIDDVVKAYLKCGDLKQGFARIRCTGCGQESLLAFSCKGRWFCPTCHAKKVIQFGEWLKDEILYPVPHRQYVFSLPKIIRKFFRYNPKLLSALSRCAHQTLLHFFRTVLNLPKGIPAMVMSIQTFGDYCDTFHPHIHALVADGLFTYYGTFYVMPRFDMNWLAEIFRANVLKMLREHGLIDEVFIRKIMKWRYNSGFSVHNRVRIERDDERGQEALAQYIIRNTFSVKKIMYVEKSGAVIYRSKMTHGKSRKNFKVFTAEEFIAAITQHIPEKSFQLVRYTGWYSNRTRGKRKKYGLPLREGSDVFDLDELFPPLYETIDVREHLPRKIPPKTWRDNIKKIWGADPLICPRCGSIMKIVAFINKPSAIQAILKHLHMWEDEPEKERAPPKGRVYEPFIEAA